MPYAKFVFQAFQKAIKQLDNGTWYLEPEWKYIICSDIIDDLSKIEDGYLSGWQDVECILRLETDRRNAQDSKKNEVINWLYDVLSQSIDPIITDEENNYLENVVEYLKYAHEKNNVVQFPTSDDKV